ncbi:MAG: ABC transporter ATP-binding protein [Candidatus Hodarchaeales archaeon]|jgi:ABC-type Fe3+/spermidine/putrescine transport system ATPase subunit
MPDVELRKVSKHFGQVKAIRNVNFRVRNREYFSMLGPSGCGKTTILRMIAGLIEPTAGSIFIDGKDVIDIPPHQRGTGYVFQHFAIFPHMDVWENVAYGPLIAGIPEEEIEERVYEALSIVHLEHRPYAYPRELSAPDLQRTGIARVLASGARLLLLDEPIGTLDLKIREEFQDELRRIVKEFSLTAIHVTHDQAEALAISDRILVLRQGQFQQVGTPETLYYRPRKPFVGHFLGESAFFEGTIVRKSSTESATPTRFLFRGGYRIRAPKTSVPVGYRALLGIRKEFIELSPRNAGETKPVNAIPGIVREVRFLGTMYRIIVELESRIRFEVKASTTEESGSFHPGDLVWAAFPADRFWIFKYPRKGLAQALAVT